MSSIAQFSQHIAGLIPATTSAHFPAQLIKAKNAYAKLDINMQSELFYLFIDSLMSSEGYSDGDPLQQYLRRPGEKVSAQKLARAHSAPYRRMRTPKN